MRSTKLPTQHRFLTSAVVASFLAVGCGTASVGVPSQDLTGMNEDTAATADAVTASYPVGSILATTGDLNLRTGASTSHSIRLVIPKGAHVTVESTTVSGGWYNVKYSGTTGWSYGGYLKLVSVPGSGGESAADKAIDRAKTGVGYSYYWGHGSWGGSTHGSCTGGCPSCTHKGSYGADCSGFAAKVWEVPSTNNVMSSDSHPYSTYNFRYDRTHWSSISRDNIKRADALTYNIGGEGHIVIYDSGSPWGNLWAYEAKGCQWGIIHDIRTASSSYITIRRDGY